MQQGRFRLGIVFGVFLLCAQQPGPVRGEPQLPPGTIEKQLSFTTSEGTWLSLDIFPDGRRLVFELLGDLYTLPISGGRADALTRGPGFDSQPAVSADGRHIAFVSDRSGAENLWVMRIDGSQARQLTFDHWAAFASPAWRPDGRSIVVSRTNNGNRSASELLEYDLSGTVIDRHSPINVAGDVRRDAVRQVNAIGAAFSPDGRFLYYARRFGRHPRQVTFPVWSIHRVDMASGRDEIFIEEPGSAFRPKPSPDGQWLAYGMRLGGPEGATTLKVMNLRTGARHVIYSGLDRDDQESDDFNQDILPNYAFTPDSRALIVPTGGGFRHFAVSGGAQAGIPFSAQVDLTMANAGNPRNLINPRGAGAVRLIKSPALSPDGRQVAFCALNGIYIVDLRTGTVRRLATPAHAFHPFWSPDGSRLAYVTWTQAEGGQVWTQRVDGKATGAVRHTSLAARYSHPVWYDENEILVQRMLLGAWRHGAQISELAPAPDLLSIHLDTGQLRSVLKARPQTGRVQKVAGEQSIYFHDAQGLLAYDTKSGTEQMIFQLIDPSTSKLLQHTPYAADDIVISPRGDFYLAKIKEQLFLVSHRDGAPGRTVELPTSEARQLTRFGVDEFGWSRDGSKIYWSLGATVSVLDVDAATASGSDLGARTQTVRIELPYPARRRSNATLVLKGATILPMTGEGPISGRAVVVTANRIRAIVADSDIPRGPDVRVLDLSGKYLLPGFVDLHAHWDALWRADGVLDETVAPFLASLAYGVTTTRDPQSFTVDLFAYRDLADSGALLAPRLLTTGPGIFSNHDFRSRAQAEDILTRYRDFYRTNTVKFYLAGNRSQRRWLMSAAHDMGLFVTSEGRNFKWDLANILDGFDGHEHTLAHAPLYEDVLKVMVESGVTYTPVLALSSSSHAPLRDWERIFPGETRRPRLERFHPPDAIEAVRRKPDKRREARYYVQQAAAARALVERGGRVGVGSHANGSLQGLRYHWELWTLVAGERGLTPHQALISATKSGAEALGLAQDLGTIEAGKLADLIVLEDDPLQNIRNSENVLYTMIDGRLLESETLATIWPEERPAPSLWWHKHPIDESQSD